MNRRKHPRFDAELRCSFVGDTYTGEGTVLDLSMEGCRVRSNTPLLKDAYVDLFITLLGQIPPLPVELAVIRWSERSVFGLEFIRIADRHQARLRRYIQDLDQALRAMGPVLSTGGGAESALSHADNRQKLATILLVEDIDVMRGLVRTILMNYGYTVVEANDGDTCVKMAQEYPGPIHLLLADMFIPGMNGRQVADHLLTSRHGMKVLFMSGQSLEKVRSHGGFDPGFGFLRKPFTPETLLRNVSEMLGASLHSPSD